MNFLLSWLAKPFHYFRMIAGEYPSTNGMGFQCYSRMFFDEEEKFVLNLVKRLPENLNIIELAAGRGTLAEEIAHLPNVNKIIACDMDDRALDVLRKKVKKSTYLAEKLTVIHQDLRYPRVQPNESFDMVIAHRVIHCLNPDEAQAMFLYACQLLKSGGILVICTASTKFHTYKISQPIDGNPYYRELPSGLFAQFYLNFGIRTILHMDEEYLKQLSEETGFIKGVVDYSFNCMMAGLCKK